MTTDGGNDENRDGDCADHHDNDENRDIHDNDAAAAAAADDDDDDNNEDNEKEEDDMWLKIKHIDESNICNSL